MKILIFGNGQFAKLYAHYFKLRDVQCSIAEGVDIRERKAVDEVIRTYNPDVIINTAAKANLDWCEDHRLEAFDNNVLGTEVLALACLEARKLLVHISTGCMQESLSAEQSHKEEDPINPTSFYSWTKAWADQMLMVLANRKGLKVLILRPRQPVSAIASRRNALLKMLTFSKFINTPNSITVLEDFIEVTHKLITQGARGVYNVANPGILSPLGVAKLLKEYINPDMEITEISKSELNSMTRAERIDSVLDISKLEATGIKLLPIETRLREILPMLKKDIEANPNILQATKQDTLEKLNLKSSKE